MRKLVLWGIAVLCVLLSGIISLISYFVLYSGYQAQEMRQGYRVADRIHKAAMAQAEAMAVAAQHLAYVDKRDPKNFQRSVRASNRKLPVHIAMVVGSQGKVLKSVSFPYSNERVGEDLVPVVIDPQEFVMDTGINQSQLLSDTEFKSWVGILRVKKNLAGLVSIVPWRGAHSEVGILVTAEVLNNNNLAKLGRLNNLTSSLEFVSAHETTKEVTEALDFSSTQGVYLKEAASNLQLKIPLTDLRGKIFGFLSTTLPMTILNDGISNIRNLIGAVVLISIGLGLTFLLFLEKYFVGRIERLANDVEQIHGVVERRIKVDSADEIGRLATEVNHLLEQQEAAQREIRDREVELLVTNENLEALIRERTAKLEEINAVFQNAIDGFVKFDRRGRIEEMNAVFATSFGYEMDMLVGSNWEQLMAYSDLDRVYQDLEKSIAERAKVQISCECVRRDSSHGVFEVTVIPRFGEDDLYDGMYWFVRDVTERKRLEARISFQAFNDELTGLPNRSMFTAHLETELRMANAPNEVAVLLMDVDNFKYINDSMGHNEGDRLLGFIADRIRDASPRGSVLARLSGDEFAMLVPNYDAERASQLAQLIFRRMHPPILIGEREVFVSCSIGIALNDDDCTTVESILKGAETAMYEAKARGKAGFAMYHSSMDANALERLELEVGLRRAIELGEFHLVYQPLIDLNTKEVTGAEALVRWNHAQLGPISPAKFIPIAEESGLIVNLGAWVLKEACEQTKKWLTAYPESNFVMSINISARQLFVPELEQFILDLVYETGLSPANLKLEITESAMMEDVEIGIAKLERLRKLGFQLAVDDFGTGHSSLSYLRRLPVNNVKIDQSFVSVLGIEDQPTAIVQAIISLCKALDLTITGEGIETAEQEALLESLGCDYGQGYLFSRPVVASLFETQFLQREQDLAA